MDEKTGFKIGKFGQLTSALVYQIDSDSCVSKLKDAEHSNDIGDKESTYIREIFRIFLNKDLN